MIKKTRKINNKSFILKNKIREPRKKIKKLGEKLYFWKWRFKELRNSLLSLFKFSSLRL